MTFFTRAYIIIVAAVVAQLVAHRLGKAEVTGPNPVNSSIKKHLAITRGAFAYTLEGSGSAQAQLVGDERDEFAVRRFAAVGAYRVAEEAVEHVDVAAIPRDLDSVPYRAFGA